MSGAQIPGTPAGQWGIGGQPYELLTEAGTMAEPKKKKRTRKRKAPPPPRVEQTDEGVRVTYPERAVHSAGPARAVLRRHTPPVRCPYCARDGREGRAERITGSAPGVSHYRCLDCCDPELGRPSTFKVITEAPRDA